MRTNLWSEQENTTADREQLPQKLGEEELVINARLELAGDGDELVVHHESALAVHVVKHVDNAKEDLRR